MIVLPILKPANSFVPCLNTLSKIYIPIAYRNSLCDFIFAHAHIRGHLRSGQLHGICVKCGLMFWEKWTFIPLYLKLIHSQACSFDVLQ